MLRLSAFSSTNFITTIAALFIAVGGFCLVLQRQRLAARLVAAGVSAALSGAFVSDIAGGFIAPSIAEIFSALVAGAVGIGVAAGAWTTTLAIVVAAACVAFALSQLAPVAPFFATAFLANWLIVVAILAAPIVTITILFGGMRSLRRHILSTGRGRSLPRFLVTILDKAIGDRPRRRHKHRHIGELGVTQRARHGRGPNRY